MSLPALPPVSELDRLAEQVQEFRAASRAENTRLVYGRALRRWSEWCAVQGIEPVPVRPEIVCLYLTALAGSGRKVATVNQTLAALAALARSGGQGFDCRAEPLASTLTGIRRKIGRPPQGKRPLLLSEIRDIVSVLPATPAGLRDRALVLLGFGAALRRSEMAGLDWLERGDGSGHVEIVRQGVLVHLGRSKTDQEGRGQTVAVPRRPERDIDPVRALTEWTGSAGGDVIRGTALFRAVDRRWVVGERLSPAAVGDIVKRAAAAAGFDPDMLGGHSLRSGHATSAAEAGSDLLEIMNQTRHKKAETVRGYIRSAEMFSRNSFGRMKL